MDKFLGKSSPYAFAILRIVAGLMFALHGSQKLFGLPPSGREMALDPLMGVAGIIELVCGLLVAVGLFGGYAAFLASGQMAVAYFMAHFPQISQSMVKFFPIANQGELAVLYCFIFLYIATHGSGVWSLDSLLGTSKAKPVAHTG
jgi:putative oxidoreductase